MSNSATEYAIVPITRQYASDVIMDMRDADAEEVWAMARVGPYDAVMQSWKASALRNAAGLVNGKAVCVFGVGAPSVLSDEGAPWLLGTRALEQHARPFFRLSQGWMTETKQQYRVLANFVSAENVKSIRWLRWLGFTIGAHPAMFRGVKFYPFAWRR